MNISKRLTAAAVSSVMAVMSTAGYVTIAAEKTASDVSLNGSYTIAAQAEEKIYDAEAQVTVGEVSGKVGETVSVPVYLSIPDGDFITGIAFKAIYDKNALELTNITEPYDSGLSSGTISAAVNNSIFCFTWDDSDIKVDSTKPICYFSFKIKNGAEGKYSVKLVNHITGDNTRPIEIVHKQEVYEKNTYYDPTVTYGSVTVEEGSTDTTADAKVYEGKFYIKGEQNVPANVDMIVDVPVYMEIGSDVADKYITGVGLKAVFDTRLELVAIECPQNGGLDNGNSSISIPHGIFCYTWDDKNITVDPSKPACVFKFRIREGANGKYDIKFINHLAGNETEPIEVIHKQELYKPNTYLTPVVTNGSIIVTDEVITTAKTEAPAQTTTTSTTSASSATSAPSKDPNSTTTASSKPDNIPVQTDAPTEAIDPYLLYWGDVNLDEFVDLADVVVLSQYLLSSKSFPLINSTAKENADCKYDGDINVTDLSKLIEYNLGTITIDDLGPSDPALRRKSKRYQ